MCVCVCGHSQYKFVKRNPNEFVVVHFAGEVAYQIEGALARHVAGWLNGWLGVCAGMVEKNTDKLHDSLAAVVKRSSLKLIQECFAVSFASRPASSVCVCGCAGCGCAGHRGGEDRRR